MKTPKLIYCTFTDAHIEAPLPGNVYIEVEAKANQDQVSMIIRPEHFAEIKKLIEQVEEGDYTSEKIQIKWVPLYPELRG